MTLEPASIADVVQWPNSIARVWASMHSRFLDEESDLPIAQIAEITDLSKRAVSLALRDLEAVGLAESRHDLERLRAGKGCRSLRRYHVATEFHVRIFERLQAGEIRRCRFCRVIAVEKKSGRPTGDVCRRCAGKYGGILWWPGMRREAKQLVKDRRPAHITWGELLHLCHEHEAPRLSKRVTDASEHERQRGHAGALYLLVKEGLAPRAWLSRDDRSVGENDMGFLLSWDDEEEETAA